MKVSIAMASYNGAKYILEQLESFVSQERLPDELVVCDDGSSDETVSILRNFSKSAPFEVKIYENQENLGFVKNFQKAMRLCSGDVIFLSDQDDVWFESKLLEVAKTFSDNPDLVVVVNDQLIADYELRNSGATTLGNVRRLGYPDSWYVQGCCTAFRKEWLEITDPVPDGIKGHDMWLNELANLLRLRVVVDKPLQFYRRYDNNVSEAETHVVQKVKRFKLMQIYGLKDARQGWRDEITYRQEHRRRIIDRRAQLVNFVSAEVIDNALDQIDRKCSALMRRIDITSLPRRRRWASLLCFWASGGYRQLSGWKSAAKDLIRP